MNRSLVIAGSRAAALTLAIVFAFCSGARAAKPAGPATAFWYAGTRLAFDRPQIRDNALAVGLDDLGLGRFLRKLNAGVSYQPGQKYVLITSGDRRTISFTLGDPSITVDGTPQAAAFAPYSSRGTVFVPFIDLARVLEVIQVKDAQTTVLQPQIAHVEVKAENGVSLVTIHGASTLQFKRLSDAGDDRLSLAFLAIGSTLDRDRTVTTPGLRALSVTVGGTAKNPTTVLNFDGSANGTHVLVPTTSPNTLEIAFAPPGLALEGTAVPASGGAQSANAPLVVRDPQAPPPSPPPAAFRGAYDPAPAAASSDDPATAATAPALAPTALPSAAYGPTPTAQTLADASVTAITTDATDATFDVHLAITGPVTFEWHRLADFRWYVDLKPATLAIDPQETPVSSSAVQALRLKPFVGPNDKLDTVRLGLTLPSPRVVTIVPTATGVTISVGATDDPNPQVAGTGEIANGQILAIVPLPAPAPLPSTGLETSPWKFGGETTVARNPRLIVIDPGHGGSDYGAQHNGMNEKDLTLDMSRRLRALLVARGWQVKMTRDSDVDVYQPNDSAHDELQARCDVANNAGARLFISVHVNAFTTSSLNGTTTYYYKDDSLGLATAVHARLASTLPTADDGIRKENFYVIHHSEMPAILVETAFLSNPSDAAYLRTDAFKDQIARAIAAGVGDYAKPGAASLSDGQ
jgi:N-acetylmuramoyl-L-alanine amidase CwlD